VRFTCATATAVTPSAITISGTRRFIHFSVLRWTGEKSNA
jgi:hypothetical protein